MIQNEVIPPIKILLLEDSSKDVELITFKLKADGLDFIINVVENGKKFEQALLEYKPDIVLSDYRLPLFDGSMALAMVREKYPEIPFIFVSGTIGEEKAIESLHMGATDFVLKGDLTRLASAVRRAIEEIRIKGDRQKLFLALKESEKRYRSLIENLPVGIFRTTLSQPGRFIQANIAMARIFDVGTIEELLKIPPAELYADIKDRIDLLTEVSERGFVKGKEIRYKTIRGNFIWCSITSTCHYNPDGQPDWLEGILEDITEKKQAEEQLTANLKLLGTLIDTVESPIYYKDNQGLYLGCNLAFSSLIAGLPQEGIIGRNDYEILDAVNQELRYENETMDAELIKNPGTKVHESSVKCADGILRHFLFHRATYPDSDGNVAGIVGVMIDITDRVNVENELRKINEEMDLRLSSITSIIIGVSVKDRITHWNSRAEYILGIDAGDALGKRLVECNVEWDWNQVYEAISISIINNATASLDNLKFTRPDGTQGIMGMTVNPLKRGGDVLVGFIIMGRDITERRLMEHQLLQARKLEAIGQLAAGVAHEINSPLQYIGGNLSFIGKSVKELLLLIDSYRDVCLADKHETYAESIIRIEEASDYTYIREELLRAVDQSMEGLKRYPG
jgi:PAS domain S-box-containing protein